MRQGIRTILPRKKQRTGFLRILVSCLMFLVAAPLVFAAEIFFDSANSQGLENLFTMNVFLKTSESLNAIEGKINFPLDFLELKNIEDGNSLINFWLERPEQRQGVRDKEQGEIVFSGITPGGYVGEKGLIFSMTFLVKREGQGTFKIHDARVLRNDGKGTTAQLQTFDSQFIISQKTSAIEIPTLEMRDTDSPESFTPEIAKDETLFDGKWFVVFATQDKASGIDHYEIKETRSKRLGTRSWIRAESPHVLRDQELRSFVFVKAVDKAGNERIVKINPQNPLAWYENYENWIIIIIGLLIIAFMARVFKRHGTRDKEQGV